MQHMITLMQVQLDEIKEQVRQFQDAAKQKIPIFGLDDQVRFKPLIQQPQVHPASASDWAKLTPEQRSEERKRRHALGKKNKTEAATKAVDEYESEVNQTPNVGGQQMKKYWANMTSTQRKKWLKNMAAGREKAREARVNGRAEA